MEGMRMDIFPTCSLSLSSSSPFSSRLLMIPLQNFEYPWDVQSSMFLLLCLLKSGCLQFFGNSPWNKFKILKKNLAECLKKVCHHPVNSKETQTIAIGWGLAYAYQAEVNAQEQSKGTSGLWCDLLKHHTASVFLHPSSSRHWKEQAETWWICGSEAVVTSAVLGFLVMERSTWYWA